jgi:hypothetical protein
MTEYMRRYLYAQGTSYSRRATTRIESHLTVDTCHLDAPTISSLNNFPSGYIDSAGTVRFSCRRPAYRNSIHR